MEKMEEIADLCEDLFEGVGEPKWDEEGEEVETCNILMSSETPEGWKLEELLQEIIHDLRVKNENLKTIPKSQMMYQDRKSISDNNLSIISKLKKCVFIQQNTLNVC